jgi:hypothetical protein
LRINRPFGKKRFAALHPSSGRAVRRAVEFILVSVKDYRSLPLIS